MKKITAS